MSYTKPMLCQEIEVNGYKEYGMDENKVTDAYRKAIIEELKKLMIRWYVSERKWDGTRVLVINEDGTITLQNRHGIPYTIRLSDVVKALQPYHGSWKLDSEIVYINPKTGKEEFAPCQRRCSTQYPDPFFVQQYPVKMMTFDILSADGTSLERRPYLERKDTLHGLLAGEDDIMEEGSTIEYVPYEKDLVKAWNEVVAKNREGLITKQVDSPYEEGNRSYNWLKVKNWRFECCNVVGYTPGERARSSFFGSLVLERKGRYRGSVGSGFNEWELRKFKDLFSDAPRIPKPYTDEQVGEPYTPARLKTRVLVKYYEVTAAGVMRFPIFVNSD